MKFFKMFNKKETAPVQEEPNILSAIMFSIDDNGEVFVDINIGDQEKESIKSLSSVLTAVASPEMPVTVLDMIKNSLIKDGKTEEYICFITDYMLQTDNLLKEYGVEVKDEPYIKPSDMI